MREAFAAALQPAERWYFGQAAERRPDRFPATIANESRSLCVP